MKKVLLILLVLFKIPKLISRGVFKFLFNIIKYPTVINHLPTLVFVSSVLANDKFVFKISKAHYEITCRVPCYMLCL